MIWFVLLAVLCTAGSQLLQALAARKLSTQEASQPSTDSSFVLSGLRMLLEPRVLGAYALLAIGLLLWLIALTELDVSATYPMFAIGFVLTMLVARFGLGEAVSLRGWCGAFLIVTGSVLCNL